MGEENRLRRSEGEKKLLKEIKDGGFKDSIATCEKQLKYLVEKEGYKILLIMCKNQLEKKTGVRVRIQQNTSVWVGVLFSLIPNCRFHFYF